VKTFVLFPFCSSQSRLAVTKTYLALLVFLLLPAFGRAQDTGYVSGTVTDKSGAAVVGAEVTVSSTTGNLIRSTTTNTDGAYAVPGLAGGTYNVSVAAKGFQKFTAQNVVLNVADKARIDVTLTVGTITEEVVVTGESVAQVETTSSDLSGTVNGKQITELQLNGRNFVQLATIVPGVSNQTGQDEGTVGVYGNVQFSFNGGRTEYNNWELDGGDNMDNGSNATLNVYPSIDAIAEFKVLTSNYGAQYGRNASGTVEVETKSGTNAFHGNAYYFGRNDALNARNFFEDKTEATPKFKKHDFGYTFGGPIFIPSHYNSEKKKTFFFWSQEWRRDIVPGQVFHVSVPSLAERAGDFTDVCSSAQFSDDCPNVPNTAAIPVDPNAAPLLAMIPVPTITDPAAAFANCGGIACYNASPSQPTHWREELIRVDHNFTSKVRGTFRYIHDSWDTVTATTLWADGSFPTIQTNFVGPGTSFVARLNAEISPTLLNEFVASYTGDHIFLKNQGPGVLSRSEAGLTTTGIFPDFGDKLPDISLTGNNSFKDITEGQAYIPWDNANPTYTLRDNVTKIIGTHTLQFGAYAVIAQKNEQSSFGAVQGALSFNASNSVVGTGNAFADLLLGNIDSYSQASLAPKYYFRYQIVEPYFQDDWRVTKRLTLNLGVRLSLFGTYRDKYKQAFNFEPSLFQANAVAIASDGSLVDPATDEPLSISDPRVTNGVVQCGASGQPSGCVKGHLFNPGPRVGFAYDPWGNGKTAIRGGYGIFYEHGNGNEANVESLEATPPLVLVPSQPNIPGYTNIGSGGGAILAFPLGFNSIETKGVWPYMQQWNLNVQHEFPFHFVSSVAYVGSKGTHLGRARDINQLTAVTSAENPFGAGQPLTSGDCDAFSSGGTLENGTPVTGQAFINLGVACGNDPNPNRPFLGFGSVSFIQYQANSSYHSLQFAVNRSLAPLTLSAAYTYSHSIDNSSDRFDSSYVDAFDIARARASSNFDQRHLLNFSYVYDLPFFRHSSGVAQTALGGWQWAGIVAIQTGTPFSVTDSNFSDNAGVSNGAGPGTFADLVGDPKSSAGSCAVTAVGPQLYNPCAFADPRGLTFGDAGRNILRNPRTTNFDMSLAKNFKFNEATGFQFRAEAFNVFNHTQWNGVSNDFTNTDFLHPTAAHRARTLQFGLKFFF
jgi:Carboxypeptidase regulatory-like domain